MVRTPYVAVVGPGEASAPAEADADAVGRLLAREGAVVVCGGLGGIMAAACRGAKGAGGVTLAILPGADRSEANPWADVAVATGMGEARNALVARTADAMVAIGGGYGTLSEVALALRLLRPVVGLRTWDIGGVEPAHDPSDAVGRVMARLARPGRTRRE